MVLRCFRWLDGDVVDMPALSRLILICLVLASGESLASDTIDPTKETYAQSELENVVRVESGEKDGAGFIVARDSDIVWVVTAAHVAYPQGPLELPAANIRVQLRGQTRWWNLAEAPKIARTDIAFLPVKIPQLENGQDNWLQLVLDKEPKDGVTVRIAATPSAIEYGKPAGHVVLDATGSFAIVGMPFGAGGEGQSGAPVADDQGFVGMYVQSAGQRVIPISEIEVAAHKANVPWMLTSFLPSRDIRLCVHLIGASAKDILASTRNGTVSLDESGCVITQSGDETITSVRPNEKCVPEILHLSTDRDQSITIHCGVRLEGQWTAGTLGHVKLTKRGELLWDFEGLENSPEGWVKGQISLTGNLVGLTGHTQNGGLVIGSLTLSDQTIFGEISVNGTSVHIDLIRE